MTKNIDFLSILNEITSEQYSNAFDGILNAIAKQYYLFHRKQWAIPSPSDTTLSFLLAANNLGFSLNNPKTICEIDKVVDAAMNKTIDDLIYEILFVMYGKQDNIEILIQRNETNISTNLRIPIRMKLLDALKGIENTPIFSIITGRTERVEMELRLSKLYDEERELSSKLWEKIVRNFDNNVEDWRGSFASVVSISNWNRIVILLVEYFESEKITVEEIRILGTHPPAFMHQEIADRLSMCYYDKVTRSLIFLHRA